MRTEQLPLAAGRVAALALLLFGPLALAAMLGAIMPAKPGDTGALAAGILGLCAMLMLAIFGAIAMRRSVTFGDRDVIIRHSFYTIRIDAQAWTGAALDTVGQSGITFRKNGIAAFGYYSGWFAGARGDTVFCAIGGGTLYRIATPGHARCSAILIGCSAPLAHTLRQPDC